MRPSYDWHEAFEAALLGPDRWKVNAAQAAIDRRLQEMNADHGGSPAERYAIQTAQAGLNVLRKHAVFQFPVAPPTSPVVSRP